jgi:hypothetical protein
LGIFYFIWRSGL